MYVLGYPQWEQEHQVSLTSDQRCRCFQKLNEFIERAVEEQNSTQRSKRSIFKAFDICGLNPWTDDLSKFDDHLKSLNDNAIYSAMLKNNKAVDL